MSQIITPSHSLRTGIARLAKKGSYAGGQVWTPANLADLGLWTRADDFTSAGTKTTWADRALTGAGTPTAPGTFEPTVTLAVLNGKPGVLYAQKYFSGSISVTTNVGTLFVVARMQSTAGSNGRVLAIGNATSDTIQAGYHLRRDVATQAVLSGTNSLVTVGQAVTYGSAFILVGVRTAAEFTTFLNGVAGASVVTGTGAFASTRYVIGARPDTGGTVNASTNGWADYIFEVLIVKAALVQADREKLEGYAAHWWGLTGLLSSGHPYKNAAPTV